MFGNANKFSEPPKTSDSPVGERTRLRLALRPARTSPRPDYRPLQITQRDDDAQNAVGQIPLRFFTRNVDVGLVFRPIYCQHLENPAPEMIARKRCHGRGRHLRKSYRYRGDSINSDKTFQTRLIVDKSRDGTFPIFSSPGLIWSSLIRPGLIWSF